MTRPTWGGVFLEIDDTLEDIQVVNNLYFTNGRRGGDPSDLTFWEAPEPRWWGSTIEPNLITGDAGVVADLTGGDVTLVDGSPAVDAGIEIEDVTDGYAGDAPDLGANELGSEPFQAGATWTVTDTDIPAPASNMCVLDD
jgi:hypothetical protein